MGLILLGQRRRQAGEVEIKAAQQCLRRSARRWITFAKDEGINRMLMSRFRHWWTLHRLKRPMLGGHLRNRLILWIGRAGVDPLSQHFDLPGGESFAFRRHALIFIVAEHAIHQGAAFAVT